MQLADFVKKYLGKKIDFDGKYGGQCVDLFRQYVKEVLGTPNPDGVDGAADFWTNYDKDPNLKNYFDKIPNTPTGLPQAGDVMIWNRKAGGGYGHISVFLDGDLNFFTSFDQNWPTLDECTKTVHNYKNLYGWLRPKKSVIGLDRATAERLVSCVVYGFPVGGVLKRKNDPAIEDASAFNKRVEKLLSAPDWPQELARQVEDAGKSEEFKDRIKVYIEVS